MARKGIISAVTGVAAGLLMLAVYLGAPFWGVHVTTTTVTVFAAVAAFCASISLMTLTALTQTEKKKPAPQRRLSELSESDYPHFPRHGLKIVLKPDTVVEELDAFRRPEGYADKDIFLVIKRGKGIFNPIKVKDLLVKINFPNFLHVLLVDEHDEYLAYIPAFKVRTEMTGANGEASIIKYIINVLADPDGKGDLLRPYGALAREDTMFDYQTVEEAKRRVAGGFHGFVVFRHKSLRKPVGVIYESNLADLETR